ncbi:MAG: SDR family oxidoreductase [Myxococcota bacterium]
MTASAPGPEDAARVALVTGASSGIGAATAQALGALGWPVALGARRLARLEEVAAGVERLGGRAFVHALDVGDPDSIEVFFEAVEKTLGPPDVVVNNAGIGRPALLHEARVEELREEITTNLLGPLWVSRRALPALREKGRGDLVFISSLNAVAPRTYQAAYTASKAGVEGVARVLQMELEGTGVRASIVRPGPTGSEFGSGFGDELARSVVRSWRDWGVLRSLRWLSPDSVARAVVQVVTAPPGTRVDVLQVLPET